MYKNEKCNDKNIRKKNSNILILKIDLYIYKCQEKKNYFYQKKKTDFMIFLVLHMNFNCMHEMYT